MAPYHRQGKESTLNPGPKVRCLLSEKVCQGLFVRPLLLPAPLPASPPCPCFRPSFLFFPGATRVQHSVLIWTSGIVFPSFWSRFPQLLRWFGLSLCLCLIL